MREKLQTWTLIDIMQSKKQSEVKIKKIKDKWVESQVNVLK